MKYFDDGSLEKIRKGYFSAVYFNRTKYILEKEKNYKSVTMQVFQKHEGSMLCGIEEVIELLKEAAGYYKGGKWVSKWSKLSVKALKDGDVISPWETVMHITGPYVYFAHLESLYLGILARRTLVATNTSKIIKEANGKPVVFFGDRFDHFGNQEGDGYAAHIGGAAGVCTPAHTFRWKGQAQGTIPHALIAINGGDTVKATELFEKYFGSNAARGQNFLDPQLARDARFQKPNKNPEGGLSPSLILPSSKCDLRKFYSLRSKIDRVKNVKIIALVDFDNDCVRTALEVAKALKGKLWGVRLDTAENMIDKNLTMLQRNNATMEKNLYGVNPKLVKLVREALDKEGFKSVKIVVSGGFDADKVKWFEEERAPVDVYGVGSGIIHGENDFTADVVMVEDKKIAKVGREYRENHKLKVAGPHLR